MNDSINNNLAYGIGIATQNEAGQTLEVWYHSLGIGKEAGSEKFADLLSYDSYSKS
jgi:hypothetical protein